MIEQRIVLLINICPLFVDVPLFHRRPGVKVTYLVKPIFYHMFMYVAIGTRARKLYQLIYSVETC